MGGLSVNARKCADTLQGGRAEKQRRGHQSSGRLDHLTELQLWQRALTHINVARRKAGEHPVACLHVHMRT